MTQNYDKALRRITTILSRLYQGEKLKAKDLADEFNVSLRTIQRDLSERPL
ncbi:MAG: HTH domain-containing protein [Campylobacterota bacterium]|nr:HTH domain-containing protein [Campylobacterota bacterium]